MTIEAKYGVPTVAMHTDKFDRVVRVGGGGERDAGPATGLRAPADHGQDGRRAPRLRGRHGSDHGPARHAGGRRGAHAAVRRRRSADRVAFDRSTPRSSSRTPRRISHRLFLDNHWTDMLPIVLPTEARVAAMLRGTRRRPDEVVGRMRSDALPRALGVHGREGRGERGDGGRAPRVLPGDPGPGRDGRDRAQQQLERHGVDGGGERPDPRARSA